MFIGMNDFAAPSRPGIGALPRRSREILVTFCILPSLAAAGGNSEFRGEEKRDQTVNEIFVDGHSVG